MGAFARRDEAAFYVECDRSDRVAGRKRLVN
jgi:hypothetical protein